LLLLGVEFQPVGTGSVSLVLSLLVVEVLPHPVRLVRLLLLVVPYRVESRAVRGLLVIVRGGLGVLILLRVILLL
jgi:hypothetical protein